MVAENGADWQDIEQIWVSDGQKDMKGRIQIRVKLITAGEKN